MKIGYFLACEEFGPRELVAHARAAEAAGFHALRILDHFHPWNDARGELAQVLPTPRHFEQACERVTEEMIGESVACGPDLERHVAALQEYADAGADELFVQQIGGGHDAFFDAYARDVLPRFA